MLKITTMNSLRLALNKLNYQQKILVVGDLILDQYQYCHSTRLTPDENKPIYDIEKSNFCLGGAANVAQNLTSLGVKVALVGQIGNDYQASIFSELLSRAKINSDFVLISSSKPTSFKTRIINDDKFLFRIDKEDKASISLKLQKKIQNIITYNIKQFDACIISDYQKGALSKKLCQFIISSFIDSNKPVFVDPKGTDYSKYQKCTVITPNQKEWEIFSEQKFGMNIKKMQESGKNLYKKIKCQNIVITVGSKGMIYVNDMGSLHSPAFSVSKINASGAGDTAICAIALSFLSGLNWSEILTISNYFCSLVIQKSDTSVVDISELNRTKID